MINTGYPIFSGRPTAFLTQILPCIAIKMGLTLKPILILYSISYVLIQYGIYLICTYILKNRIAGIILILCQVLCVKGTFYYSVTEVHQAIGYGVLFFAWINSKYIHEKKLQYHLITILILLFNIYSHPYALFMIIYVIGVSLITKRHTILTIKLSLVFLTLLLIIKICINDISSNEGQNYIRLVSSIDSLSNVKELPLLQFIIMHSWKYTTLYLCAEVLLLITIVSQILRKEYLLSMFTMGVILVFTLTSSLMSLEGESGIVLEKSLIPIGFFVAHSFVTELNKRNIVDNWLILVSILLIISIKTRDIAINGSKKYQKRIAYIHNCVDELQKQPGNKFIVKPNQIDRNKIKITWAFSQETLIYSALKENLDIKTIYVNTDSNLFDLSDSTYFLGPKYNPVIKTRELNKYYFPILGHYEYYNDDLF